MKQAVRRQFNQAAARYHDAAVVQRDVATRLLEFLPTHVGERVLEVGSGSGFLTKLLLQQYPAVTLDAVDISPKMIQQARAQLGDKQHLRFFESDIMQFESQHLYDCVVSSAALQWLVPFDTGLAKLRRLLVPEGWLSFSVMTSGTLALLHELRAELFPAKVGKRRLPSVEDVARGLEANNFRCEVGLQTQRYFQRIAQGLDVLAELKAIGVTAGKAQGKSFLTRSELLELSRRYEQCCLERYGEVGVEYEVVYCAARKVLC